MRLDVYRSCSRQEKREVLDTFWRRGRRSGALVRRAAQQYGPYAVLSLIAVALELALVIVISVGRAYLIGGVAAALEVITLTSLWWAIVRTRSLSNEPVALDVVNSVG